MSYWGITERNFALDLFGWFPTLPPLQKLNIYQACKVWITHAAIFFRLYEFLCVCKS